MAKFIELSLSNGKKVSVNTSEIKLILPLASAGKTLISLDGGQGVGGNNFSVTESYADVRAMLN